MKTLDVDDIACLRAGRRAIRQQLHQTASNLPYPAYPLPIPLKLMNDYPPFPTIFFSSISFSRQKQAISGNFFNRIIASVVFFFHGRVARDGWLYQNEVNLGFSLQFQMVWELQFLLVSCVLLSSSFYISLSGWGRRIIRLLRGRFLNAAQVTGLPAMILVVAFASIL